MLRGFRQKYSGAYSLLGDIENVKMRQSRACFFTVLALADEELAPLDLTVAAVEKNCRRQPFTFSFLNEQFNLRGSNVTDVLSFPPLAL